jgi:uncharacterized membrane protein
MNRRQEGGMAMQGTRRQGAVISMDPGSRDRRDRRWRGAGNGAFDPERMATGLGWFSIGLGVAEILAPGAVARTIGLAGGRWSRTATRLVGVREIASGVGILSERRPVGWMWSRVAGDVMDLALLGAGFASRRAHRGRLAAAAAGVLGVSVVDALCAERLTGLSRLSVRYEKDGALRVRRRVTVDRPAEALYRFWGDFTNLPRFMDRVESVQVSGDRRTHWRVKGPGGLTVEWDAEVTEERPHELIAWRSLDRLPFQHGGIVRFEPAPGGRGTVVTVEMRYTPPGGVLTAAAAKLIGYAPEQQLQEDLRRFKQLMETGQIVSAAAETMGGAG